MSTIECPNCKTHYNFRPEFAGRSARCEKCSHEFSFATQSASDPRNTDTGPAESAPLQDVQIDASFPIDHVPSQFGEVVQQWPYHQPLRATLQLSAACLAVSILFAIGIFDGTFNDWYISGIPLSYFIYVFTPILAFVGFMFAKVAWTSYRKPRVIAVTKMGVYMPMAQLSWTMMFIPFHSIQPSDGVARKLNLKTPSVKKPLRPKALKKSGLFQVPPFQAKKNLNAL